MNKSCEMPSDIFSDLCYYSEEICLMECPEDMEVDNNSLIPSCKKKTSPIIPDEDFKISNSRVITNILLIAFAGILVVVIIALVIMIVYYHKKYKAAEHRNTYDSSQKASEGSIIMYPDSRNEDLSNKHNEGELESVEKEEEFATSS
jgi:hypothetical protein